MRKTAVIFPGIGYTCDRPLLYYSGKLAKKAGYEVVTVPYGNFPDKVRGDMAKMQQSFDMALDQSEKILSDMKWDDYDDILFLSKSVGTIVSSAYAKNHGLCVKNVLFTPLVQTWMYAGDDCMAFHGTADPWAGNDEITGEAEKHGTPLVNIEGANHSLETGDAVRDIEILKDVILKVREFISDGPVQL